MTENKDEPIEIKICMGSSCYSRGNSKLVKLLQEYLKNNNLEQKIELSGELCHNACSLGPNVSIAGKIYHEVDESVLIKILDETFKG